MSDKICIKCKQFNSDIEYSELLKTLQYDPETGEFRWLIDRGRAVAGNIAGSKSQYIRIRINNICYNAHRLAWLYMTGKWPTDIVDHINGNGTDNRWRNLRQCSNQQNVANQFLKKNNTSGYRGVTWSKRANKWVALIKKNYKSYNLGYFDSKHDAALAYNEKAAELFGDFARFNNVRSGA